MMILFVCTGNTCRRPMAAALLRRRLDRAGAGDIIVDSAGLAAGGETVTPEAAAAMEEIGLPIAGRRSRPLTAALCREADIIAVMTPGHAAALAAYGAPPEKIRLLGGGIPDPYGGNAALYRQTRDALELAVDALERAVDALAEELLGN